MDDDDFMRQDVKLTATLPPPNLTPPPGVLLKYFLHGCHSDESMLAGAAVISSDGLCPPFDTSPNKNMFQHLFGIEFNYQQRSEKSKGRPKILGRPFQLNSHTQRIIG